MFSFSFLGQRLRLIGWISVRCKDGHTLGYRIAIDALLSGFITAMRFVAEIGVGGHIGAERFAAKDGIDVAALHVGRGKRTAGKYRQRRHREHRGGNYGGDVGCL